MIHLCPEAFEEVPPEQLIMRFTTMLRSTGTEVTMRFDEITYHIGSSHGLKCRTYWPKLQVAASVCGVAHWDS
jgi:hypothetical protein